MNIRKTAIIALTTASLALTGLGLVSAQEAVSASDELVAQGIRQQGQRFSGGQQGQQNRHGKFIARQRGMQGRLLSRAVMTEGTSVEILLYDGNPEDGGQLLDTLSHVVGESSERVFMESVRESMGEAAYIVINMGESSLTISLPENEVDTPGRKGFNNAVRSLNEGSSLSASFYDGHPDEGGQVLTTVSFLQGESSEVAFANDVREAMSDASHVQVIISAQSQQLDLTEMRDHVHNNRRFPHGLGRSPLGN